MVPHLLLILLAGLTADSVLLGGQIRAIAKLRLLRNRGELSLNTMQQIDQALSVY